MKTTNTRLGSMDEPITHQSISQKASMQTDGDVLPLSTWKFLVWRSVREGKAYQRNAERHMLQGALQSIHRDGGGGVICQDS